MAPANAFSTRPMVWRSSISRQRAHPSTAGASSSAIRRTSVAVEACNHARQPTIILFVYWKGGRAEIRTAAAETFALVPDLTFTQVDLRVGDDFWVVRWKLSGTSVTGSAVDVDIADMVTVEEGAVKAKHTYVDGVAMQAALTAPAEID